jgi:hypothetical protein
MSWSIRLKLNMLPILDSNGIDGIILSRDIYARLGIPREWSDKLKTKTAVKVFYSAASAEGYTDEHTFKGAPLNFGILDAWKRLGHCLVHLSCGLTHPPGFPPVPLECIVRTAESAWELYNLSETEESKVDHPNLDSGD